MSVRLAIKVVPGASRSAISGWLGEELKIRVAAPPEKGKANREIIRLLGAALKLPAAQLSIVAGQTSPRKTVKLEGIDQAGLERVLGRPGQHQ